jgi:hypothetical protein
MGGVRSTGRIIWKVGLQRLRRGLNRRKTRAGARAAGRRGGPTRTSMLPRISRQSIDCTVHGIILRDEPHFGSQRTSPAPVAHRKPRRNTTKHRSRRQKTKLAVDAPCRFLRLRIVIRIRGSPRPRADLQNLIFQRLRLGSAQHRRRLTRIMMGCPWVSPIRPRHYRFTSILRITFLSSLPTPVLGSAATNRTSSGLGNCQSANLVPIRSMIS